VPEIVLERTPLSSRVAIVERAMSEAGGSGSGDTPRPSIYLRGRTHRFQNIAAAIAVIVIIILVLLGRRTPPNTEEQAAGATSGSAPTPAHSPRTQLKPLPSSAPRTPASRAVAPAAAPTSLEDASDEARDE
jgi:hypothetical protein